MSSDDRTTTVLDPRDIHVSWPIVIASLEKIGSWTVLALRLGTLALLQECTRQMSLEDAPASLVDEARRLVEALAHMPWERK